MSSLRAVVVVATTLSTVSLAVAADIYSTGFESPEFAAGGLLNGQSGWTVPAPFLSPSAATVEAANPASGAQAVRVRGLDMVDAPQVGPDLAAVGSYRHTVNYNTAATNLTYTSVSADVRLDGPQSTAADFFSCNLATVVAGDGGLEISLSSDRVIYAYDNNTGSRIGAPFPIAFGTYYHLTGVADFATNTYSAFVNGILIASAPFNPASTTLGRGSLVVYAGQDSGADVRSSYTAYFDNFAVTAVPSPASLAVFPAAALAVVRRRRSTGR